MGCSPYGKRDLHHDLSCYDTVPSLIAGYCACEDGKRTAFSDCRHPTFTCAEKCAQLPSRFCDAYNSSLRSNSASGCSNEMTLKNTLSEDVQVYQVNENGIDTFVLSLPKHISYTVFH